MAQSGKNNGKPAGQDVPAPTSAFPEWAMPGERRSVQVGWILNTDKSQFIWDKPRRTRQSDPAPEHAKAANYCPGVIDHESRLFEIPCPFDMHLRIVKTADGQLGLTCPDGDRSPIRLNTLTQVVSVLPPTEWRHPKRPIVQIYTPYLFIADEPVWMSQLPPFDHYRTEPWPGVVVSGRLPIHIWPRQLMWAFEWHDTTKDLILTRGEPWFYARFEAYDPSRPVRVVEAVKTEELDEHIRGATGVSNYIDQTWQLFKIAEERRPARLLVPKMRDKGEQEDGAGTCPVDRG